MIHHFYESQKRETEYFDTADSFYRHQFGALKIDRCDYNTSTGKAFQQNDIDLWLTLKDKRISVSEKRRMRDFGDLYLEIYSKYPHAPGWVAHSEADFMAYFFPERVFWAGFRQIIRFYRESLLPQISDEWLVDLKNSHTGKSAQEKHTIKIAGDSYSVLLIQAYNESRGSSWYTMGISIPFAMLKDNHIKFRVYSTIR